MKQLNNFIVLNNTELNSEHFLIELQCEIQLPEILPGQFVNVLVENSKTTFLRRPFSIHFVDYSNNSISLFIKKAGEGTLHLSLLKKGDKLNIIYPLGNAFTIPDKGNLLLTGGGCGVAPLLFLSKYINKKGIRPKILIGARTENDVHRTEEFLKYGDVLLITEDGSAGEKGLITQHSIFQSTDAKINKIYSCGPEPMMKAIAEYAYTNNIECEVTLENSMACGFGVCLCCVVDTKEGNKCACTEGPVFNIKDLKWQI